MVSVMTEFEQWRAKRLIPFSASCSVPDDSFLGSFHSEQVSQPKKAVNSPKSDKIGQADTARPGERWQDPPELFFVVVLLTEVVSVSTRYGE
jgi:hypothetical protein